MPDTFFSRSKSNGLKRKRSSVATNTKRSQPKRRLREEEEIESDEQVGEADGGESSEGDSSVDGETAAQKRIRLASLYLSQLENAQDDQDVSERLQQDVLADAGKVYLHLAESLKLKAHCCMTPSANGHRLPLTCAVLSADSSYLYTASKEGSIIKWAFNPTENDPKLKHVKTAFKRKRPRNATKGFDLSTVRGHIDEIYSLSISDDGRILASGGIDRVLGVWSVQGDALEWKKGLKSHKDAISSLSFRRGTTQCYTASFDRTVKVYDLEALTYIDTLFGHQEKILDLSVLKSELAITAGGSDKSVRYFKVADETQLVFRGGGTVGFSSRLREVIEGSRAADDLENDEQLESSKRRKGKTSFMEGSIECVSMTDNTHFVSGGNSGTISLWTTSKKKPIYSVPLTHGMEDGRPRWVTSVAALPFSDLFVSGSWDGQLRIWALDRSLSSFKQLFAVPLAGVINSLQVMQDVGSKKVFVVAALGQEHKFGRWFKVKEGRNRAAIVSLS